MKMWRQGDVLIIEAKRDPRTQYQNASSNVLVYGEATGHAHRVEAGDGVAVLEWAGNKVIDAGTPFRVVHEEHATIEIPEGFYRVLRQREYDEKEIRYVAD